MTMFGEPSDVEGECNARLFIADNYGDGSATIRCHLAPGHEGLHREVFERRGSPVTITWAVDERTRCDHGCGQWEHDHRDIVVLATASIDGSHGGARSQKGLRASARIAPGHYEVRIAGVLPPDALVAAQTEFRSVVSIMSTIVGDVVHVQTIGQEGAAVDADFRIEVARPLACPRDAEEHEYSDCAYCHPGEDPLACVACGKTYYDVDGHRRHCAGEPYACTDCGENGTGAHVCPRSFDEDAFAP
jgi:hypothetical protein